MSQEQYFGALINMQVKAMSALATGGFLVLLIGDYVKNGRLIQLTREVPLVGTPYRSVVKLQHNVSSRRILYSGRYIAIQHEVAHFLRRDNPSILRISTHAASFLDLRQLRARAAAGLRA